MTETRLAVQDGTQLVELYVERAGRRSIVGNIYKGVVTNVLPGMQAAFVDIGLRRTPFSTAATIRRTGARTPAPIVPDAEEDATSISTTASRGRGGAPT